MAGRAQGTTAVWPYTQRGFQRSPSREPTSSRTNLVQASGKRGNHGTHLLSPASASGFFWDTGIGVEPSAPVTKAEQQSEEGEELDSAPSEEEDTIEGVEKTGAELLAEKRKMKRFRLTHAQTRYLLSEFTRQAHPDSGQRERLARDIPGLSPRQVQVWFQNRRAKQKETRKRGHRVNVRSRVSESRVGAMPQRPTLRLGLDQRNLPPKTNSAASVYTNVPSGVGAAIGSANLSPVSSINEGSQYLGSYSETQSLPTQYSHPFNPQQRRTELFWQRISSSAQPTPEIAGNTSTYRDYDFPAPGAPSQPQNAPQHSATFPQVQNPTSRMSPLATWNTMLYDQRQTIYPQADAGTGSISSYQGPIYDEPTFSHGVANTWRQQTTRN